MSKISSENEGLRQKLTQKEITIMRLKEENKKLRLEKLRRQQAKRNNKNKNNYNNRHRRFYPNGRNK